MIHLCMALMGVNDMTDLDGLCEELKDKAIALDELMSACDDALNAIDEINTALDELCAMQLDHTVEMAIQEVKDNAESTQDTLETTLKDLISQVEGLN